VQADALEDALDSSILPILADCLKKSEEPPVDEKKLFE
jgi:hypothetical protein